MKRRQLVCFFLRSVHEEADTGLVLHAVHCKFSAIPISSEDNDVLLLLVSHFSLAQWNTSG